MVMDEYYAQKRLHEVWMQIGSLHLIYLELEDSPQKLEERSKLEDCIREFLCLAPHTQKFTFSETAGVLRRSASAKKDFSGYKAALGWTAIAMYASNLLNQPWRKEYRQIKMYSGYYKHQIESNLVGAEIMFEAMGFKHDANGVLTLDGPICPDMLISVSLDSIIAYVECQILKAIWEEVTKTYNATWLELLEFRETHLGSEQSAIQTLRYRYEECRYHQQHTRSLSQGSDPFASRFQISSHTSAPLLASNPLPLAPGLPPHPPHPPCAHNGYCSTYQHVPLQYASYPQVPLSTAYSKHYHGNSNGFYGNGCAMPPPPPPPGYGNTNIPTGQLVEVYGTHNRAGNYDTVDAVVASHSSSRPVMQATQAPVEPVSESKNPNSDIEPTSPASDESWDYVYRNLQSQGYSKDLSERGNLLNLSEAPTSNGDAKRTKDAGGTLEGPLNNLNLGEKPSRHPSDLQKQKETVEKRRSESRPLEVEAKKPIRHSINGIVKNATATLPKFKNNAKNKTVDGRKQPKETAKFYDEVKSSTKDSAGGAKWSCSICTFLNSAPIDICEMCGKSRAVVDDSIQVGGSECSQCTLVNPRDCRECQACGHNLKNSPTYI